MLLFRLLSSRTQRPVSFEMTASLGVPLSQQSSKQGYPLEVTRETLVLVTRQNNVNLSFSSQAQIEPYVHCSHGLRGRNEKQPSIFIRHLHNGQAITHSPEDNGCPLLHGSPSRGAGTLAAACTGGTETLACFVENDFVAPISL